MGATINADIHRAAREFRAIANLLSGTAPWTEHARAKAEEYAEYFEGLEALAPHAPSDFWHDQFVKTWAEICEAAGMPTDTSHPDYIGVDKFCQILRTQRGKPSEAAAQPTAQQVREKYGLVLEREIEHNDH